MKRPGFLGAAKMGVTGHAVGRRVISATAVSKSPFDSIAASLGLGGYSSSAEVYGRMFKRSVIADVLLVPATIYLSASVNVLFKVE